ncbi:MAG: histidine kinase [Sphingobacteriales bacterium]|nr:histidine kinase [Sphingobacteriales bacterium]
MKKCLFLISVSFFITIKLRGQSFYFRHYQVEQGLSNNTVFCSAQDKRGFFWMGTKDGLNRFDGYTFKVFRNNPDDSLSIGDNFIRSLYIDKDDILYAGTRNGLYRYNSVTENFTALYKTSEEIRDIKKDSNGNIWFVAGQTLMNYNEKNKKIHSFSTRDYFAATSICIDQHNLVWASTANGFLEKYNEQTDSFTPYNLFSHSIYSSPKWIEKIYATNQQSIFVGTSNYGVKVFDLKDFSYKDILTYNPDKTEIFARDFVQTSLTEFWMATESGIFIYNTISGQSVNLKKQYNNPYSVSDNAVYTLCRDKEGGIWAGTYFGGINYYPKQYATFEKFFPDYNTYSLSGNAVREICEDKYENVWVGTEDAGLNKLNKKTGLFTQYKPTGARGDISYPNIHGLLARGNELWIGTFEHGLDIMDIKTGRVIKRYPGNSNAETLRSNFIVVIYQTRKGDILIGTRQGLYRFNEASKSFDIIPEIPSQCFIHAITEDKNGVLWIGTLGNGLFYYDAATKKSENFIYQPQNKKGISSNSVTTIFETASRDLWIGTEGGGLCKFNTADSSFTNYTANEGFPSNTIFKILEDGKQQLWITTSKGLVSFAPASKKIMVYTTANGLLSNQFNYNSGYKDSTGNMYFGSAKGLIRFNPGLFVTNNFVPPLFITGFYINDKELSINTGPHSLHKAISYTQSIELTYKQSSFNIDFAALSFTAPEMTEYKYIMEGLDKDWTYLKTNRKVYFTNLSPGTYTFKVKAANSSGIWTEKITELQIKILPPFWASPLAYIIYILLTGLIIYYLFRSYHNKLKEKTKRHIEYLEHEKEKEIYQAKIEFFTNVVHEIKTPLTLIKAPMEKIIKKASDNIDIGQHLKIMERNTDRLVELTNQILDFRKIETTGQRMYFIRTNINELLHERHSSFKPLSEQKKILLTLNMPDEAVMAEVDTDSFQKILNNLLYNAFTYGKHKVYIKLFPLQENENNFTIEFSNDGHIIPPEMKEKIFNPFYRLKENQNKAGSGIGLALTRSLVDLHKGNIWLKETDNGVNTFVLSLPVNQNNGLNIA